MPDYNNNDSTDDLIAPVKKGSLGVTPSATDTSQGASTCGEPVEDGNFTYFRDRLLDKQTATRNTNESVDYVALNSDNSDQKAKTTGSKAIYVESNAPRSASPVASDVNILPHQKVAAENASVGEYSYLEPAINYNTDENENCYRSTNILYNQQQAGFLDGSEFTSYTSRKFTRAKGTFEGEIEFTANTYMGQGSPAGSNVLRNDGFCFIAEISNAAEYGTLLLDFEQKHPSDNRISPYIINNHIDDPDDLLGIGRTFASVGNNFTSKEYSILGARPIYSTNLSFYQDKVNSVIESYPYGSNIIQSNADLLPYFNYLESFKAPGSSAFMSATFSSPSLNVPWVGGFSQISVPFGSMNSAHSRTSFHVDSSNPSVGNRIDTGIHSGFDGGDAERVIWNKNSSGNRVSAPNGTVSHVIRADNSWRPYEIVVYRGTLNYNASVGAETYSDDYQEYFRFRTFDEYYGDGVFNPQSGEATGPGSTASSADHRGVQKMAIVDPLDPPIIGGGGNNVEPVETPEPAPNPEPASSSSAGTISGGVVSFKYPVTGVNNENGKFVINFSENFDADDFTEENRLKVAVIQDLVKTQTQRTSFTNTFFSDIAGAHTFNPIHEDTIQLLNQDEDLFQSTRAIGAANLAKNCDNVSGPMCSNANQSIQEGAGGPIIDSEGNIANYNSPLFDCLSIFNGVLTVFKDKNNNSYPTPASQLSCNIPVLANTNLTLAGVTKTFADWGYAYGTTYVDGLGQTVNSSILPTERTDLPNYGNYGHVNNSIHEDPWTLAGYINAYREVSWFARDLIKCTSESEFNVYKNGKYATFTKPHRGTNYVMPQPWKMTVNLIKAENITGIEHDTSRCQSNRATFQANGGGAQLDDVEKYICGQCQQNDGASVPNTAYQNGKNHEKVTEGYPETDKLKDHRSYQRVHDGGNLSA